MPRVRSNQPGPRGGRQPPNIRSSTQRLFRNGRNRALRIPRELELPGRAATLRKQGSRLIVEPVAGPSLLAVLAKLKPLEEKLAPMVRAAAEPVEL